MFKIWKKSLVAFVLVGSLSTGNGAAYATSTNSNTTSAEQKKSETSSNTETKNRTATSGIGEKQSNRQSGTTGGDSTKNTANSSDTQKKSDKDELSVKSPNVMLMDADSGAVLYKKEESKPLFPASITKIMTCLIALEKGKLTDTITFSRESVNQAKGSNIGRKEGEQLTLEQALYAMMLESSNECAYSVAEHIGGSYAKFIKLMNQKAKELGCKDTNFTNASGLPDEKHVTTAYDMALIAKAAYQNKEFRKIAGSVTYTIPATNKNQKSYTLHNHNKLISSNETGKYLYQYCVGGKTGYTVVAKHTFVAYAKKGNQNLIYVVLNNDGTSLYTDAKAAFDYGFKNYTNYSIKEKDGNLSSKALADLINEAGRSATAARLEGDGVITLPKNAEFSDVTKELDTATAQGDVLGTLLYKYKGNTVGAVNIVKSNEPTATKTEVKTKKKHHVLRNIIIILIVVAVAIYLRMVYVAAVKRRRRAERRRKAARKRDREQRRDRDLD